MNKELTPAQIVAELDRYIVGQEAAKRAVAVALRTRYRRRRVPPELREEITPKNILMIGPTGVGKTEIARRLARLVHAPFIKVEATKFTEVGYVGRDVESMVRDLTETAVRIVQREKMARVAHRAEALAEERIIDYLVPAPKASSPNPFAAFLGMGTHQESDEGAKEEEKEIKLRRLKLRQQLKAGELESQTIEIEVEDTAPQTLELFTGGGVEEMGINLQDLFGGMLPKRKRRRRVSIAEARRLLAQEEAQKLIDMDEVHREAIERAEQDGIIFIDEIDKIAGSTSGHGPDISREGVQRDILPIVEGSTVMTKYGPVRTDHILFIAAGAFHVSKPTDLIPELQGRFPLRVELASLDVADFQRILTEPQNALLKQYKALLATENLELSFTDDAITEICRMACRINEQTENIGARRLHTILEKVLEDISFDAANLDSASFTVTADYVRQRLDDIVKDRDLSRYIL
ncbi:MAG: ATP-dependent protease ATPase subunit HslU [Limnochordia bacterium]|jgi:ATP-dependent HslUV protease ATP-binding subunit HslU